MTEMLVAVPPEKTWLGENVACAQAQVEISNEDSTEPQDSQA